MLEAVVPAEGVIFYPNYFFQVGLKAWVCLLHTSEGPPYSVCISFFSLHCPVWIRIQSMAWTDASGASSEAEVG